MRPTHLIILGQPKPSPRYYRVESGCYTAHGIRWWDDASYARYQGDWGSSDDCGDEGGRPMTCRLPDPPKAPYVDDGLLF